MRAYFFTNFYLNSLSQGIQPAHCIADMFVRYNKPNPTFADTASRNRLYDWADNHKTIICLNGGANQDIHDTFVRLKVIGEALHLPYGDFHEDHYSLGGIKTCCVIS